MARRVILIVCVTLAFCLNVSADTLKLRSGKTVQGKIVEQDDRKILLDVGLDSPITYYLDEVTDIFRDTASVDVAVQKNGPSINPPAENPNQLRADKAEQEGLEFIGRGEMDRGVALLREALQLDPRANRHLNLGSILIGNGISFQKNGKPDDAVKVFEEAEAELQKAIRLFDPDGETTFISQAYSLLGEIYANALNDKVKAKTYYEKSLSFYENPVAKRGLAGL
jgi:tetratricopeptide (TPR) repeat protein